MLLGLISNASTPLCTLFETIFGISLKYLGVKSLQEDKNDLLDIAIKQPINTH